MVPGLFSSVDPDKSNEKYDIFMVPLFSSVPPPCKSPETQFTTTLSSNSEGLAMIREDVTFNTELP